MSDNAGLSKLLKAEAEAQTIIETARNNRRAQVKRAQDEAKNEIKAYQDKLEAEFKQKQEAFSKELEADKETLRLKTEANIKAIQDSASQHTDEVIKTLLDVVARVPIQRRNQADSRA